MVAEVFVMVDGDGDYVVSVPAGCRIVKVMIPWPTVQELNVSVSVPAESDTVAVAK